MEAAALIYNDISIVRHTKYSRIRCYYNNEEYALNEFFRYDQIDSINDFFNGNLHEITNKENLVSVIIPEIVTEIPDECFADCIFLEDIVFSKNLQKIGNAAFGNCSSLDTVIIPDTVDEIGRYAFLGTNEIRYNGIASGSPWGAAIHVFDPLKRRVF